MEKEKTYEMNRKKEKGKKEKETNRKKVSEQEISRKKTKREQRRRRSSSREKKRAWPRRKISTQGKNVCGAVVGGLHDDFWSHEERRSLPNKR